MLTISTRSYVNTRCKWCLWWLKTCVFNTVGLGVGVVWLCMTWWISQYHRTTNQSRRERPEKKKVRNLKIVAKGRALHASRTESIKSKNTHPWIHIERSTFLQQTSLHHSQSCTPQREQKEACPGFQRGCVGQHQINGPGRGTCRVGWFAVAQGLEPLHSSDLVWSE